MSDAAVTTNGLTAWPEDGSPSDKRELLERVSRLPASAEQARILRGALRIEDSRDLACELICAVLHHEDRESGDANSPTYDNASLKSLYRDALAAASTTRVRIALHAALAQFRPASSKDGLTDHGPLLQEKLDDSRDADEQRALVSLLRSRAGYSDERLIATFNAWLDDQTRHLTEEDVDLWSSALARVTEKEPYRADRLRTEAVTRLHSVLLRHQESSVRARALRAVADGLFDRDLEAAVIAALTDEHPGVRREAVRAAALMKERARPEVERTLVSDGDAGVLDAAWEALQSLGDEPAMALMQVARNSNVDAACEVAQRRALRSAGIPVLRRAWPALPAPFRSELERRWRSDGDWMERRFHSPMWWEFWHDLFRRHQPDGIRSAAALSWITRPLHEIVGASDFEAVSGLRRDDPVEMRTVELLRFGFLADAESFEGVPLRDALGQWNQFDLDELAELEARFDQERDHLSELSRELNQVASEVGDEVLAEVRRQSADRQRSGSDLSGRLEPAAKRLSVLVQEYEQRQLRVADHGDGGLYWRLYAASRELSNVLKRVGCRFVGLIAPDGVLGEYNPEDRTVTLFGPMIELAAIDAARTLGRPVDEVAPLTRTVVELHELAHAHVHLGRDASRGIWRQPEGATATFHEALAQSFTRRIIATMDVPGLREVLAAMEEWLPPEYRYADLLDAVDAERLRGWFVTRRYRPPDRTLDSVVHEVLKAVPGYLKIIESSLGAKALSPVVMRVRSALQAAIDADSPERAVALDILLSVLSQQPNALSILGSFLVGGWPTDDERLWLVHEARTSGPPVGRRPLRFIRKRDRVMAVSESKTAAELGLGVALRSCEAFSLPKGRTGSGPAVGPQPRTAPRRNPRKRVAT